MKDFAVQDSSSLLSINEANKDIVVNNLKNRMAILNRFEKSETIASVKMNQEEFEKALTDLKLTAFTEDEINAYRKEARRKLSANEIDKNQFEKAIDLCKGLRRVIVKGEEEGKSKEYLVIKTNKIQKARTKGAKDKMKRKSKKELYNEEREAFNVRRGISRENTNEYKKFLKENGNMNNRIGYKNFQGRTGN